jgi:hypothetical protein
VALCGIAEWHSAGLSEIPMRHSFLHPADCQSATQQISNLRYILMREPWTYFYSVLLK